MGNHSSLIVVIMLPPLPCLPSFCCLLHFHQLPPLSQWFEEVRCIRTSPNSLEPFL